MARIKKYRRPTREQVKAMSPAEKLEHQRALDREKKARKWRRLKEATTKRERTQLAVEQVTRKFNWESLLPHIDKQPNGCWRWTGAFKERAGVVRPWMKGGALGGMRADHIVCCLYRGRPPPNCFAARTCESIDCVAPEHLVWSSRAVETAKGRRRHEQEELAGRVE